MKSEHVKRIVLILMYFPWQIDLNKKLTLTENEEKMDRQWTHGITNR